MARRVRGPALYLDRRLLRSDRDCLLRIYGGYTDEGEEGYAIAIAIASALTLLAVGLCTGAAISLRGLGTMPAAVRSSLTIAVTLTWVGVTITVYLAGATSGPTSDLITTTGLTIPAALIGFLGVVATAVVERSRA